MRYKQSLLVLLVGVNLLLVAAMIIEAYPLPKAVAQPSGRSGDFVCVTAQVQGQAYEVLYVLDGPARKLHAFFPQNVQTRKLDYGGNRDLTRDIRDRAQPSAQPGAQP